MRLPMLAAAVLGAALLGGSPAQAAPGDEPGDAPGALSAQDSAFVTAAGYAGNFEVAGGSLARARGSTQAVKDFGTRMISDHNRAATKLAMLARANGMATPDLPDSAQQNILTAWSRLDGLLFDCAYVPAEYLDHVGAIGLFETEAAHGDNADLVAFARETLPTLQEHKRMITTALSALDCNG
ncbi:DUF4142 domain-containing protein [Dactylosporangium sp. CA-139114]|uniref:DUF4142 domain-containing protein n=1 Tax=Dactylosporangium sp. CA-139114 TaxID=3239931 RepID=UPI003D988CCA